MVLSDIFVIILIIAVLGLKISLFYLYNSKERFKS